jgi:uncharacterized protein YndB with AHSA1/START domain
MEREGVVPPLEAGQPALVISRLLNASCQRVYDAWTTADHVRRWMCPEHGSVAVAELDVRVGGSFRIEMLIDGVRSAFTGEYRELHPPHRLVFTWVSGHTHMRPTLVAVDLRPHGTATEMTLTQTLLPDAISRERNMRGWTMLTKHLLSYLQSLHLKDDEA